MIKIIDTGVANIRSLQAAFDRLDKPWALTTDASEIGSAKHVVLPGVGTFGAAAAKLDEYQLREALTERIEKGESTLCICLGMQLLCEASEENPGVQGLGIVPEKISRFSEEVQVPQLGWNQVTPNQPDWYESGQAYFANSFRLASVPAGWGFATTDYGGQFVSSVWRGQVLACQFHPELSGEWGQGLLKNWIEGGINAC